MPAPGPGVYSSRMLREAIEAGRISPKRIAAAQIQPARIDLRLGAKGYTAAQTASSSRAGRRAAPRASASRLPTSCQRGLLLSVDLPGGQFCGWRAKRNSALLELAQTAAYDPFDYWVPVFDGTERAAGDPAGRLHLLISKEFVSIPPDIAAEMIAYDLTNGSMLFTHYAGCSQRSSVLEDSFQQPP